MYQAAMKKWAINNGRNGLQQRDMYTFLGYALVFLLFSVRILPTNVAIALMIGLFTISSNEILPYLYLFSLPWAYVAKFSFGLTLSLVQSTVYVIRILISNRKIVFDKMELIVLFFLVGSGGIGFLLTNKLTEIGYIMYYFIACNLFHNYLTDPDKRNGFIRGMLLSILISMAIATIYGFVFDTAHARWISGMGYNNQLYGTMGTSRFGLYFCIVLLYPLYYEKNKTAKIVMFVIISALIIATISLTAILLYCGTIAYYFLTSSPKPLRVLLIISCVIALIVFGSVFWNKISEISFIKPLATRIELAVNNLLAGDVDAATTGRSGLSEKYMEIFHSGSLPEKIFGRHEVKSDDDSYSHNSYIDMLNCIGIVGFLLIMCLQIHRIRFYFCCKEKWQLILIKLLVLSGGATFSVFSAQYWQMFLYL